MLAKKDLSITIMETSKEQYFNQKCRGLLNICGEFMLVHYASDPILFNHHFTNSIISEREVNFILLKKYYITTQRDSKASRTIRDMIDNEQFKNIELLIERKPIVRGILLENYIENINISNHDASVIKGQNLDYDKMNSVLLSMKTFYTGVEYEEAKQLTLTY